MSAGCRSVALVALWILLGACRGSEPEPLPAATELSPRIKAVREAVWKNEGALDTGSLEDQLPLLEGTITELANRHGPYSVETIQGLTETAALLATKDRFDLALPFMERTLALSRDVYGLDHRDTAYALHDVATLLAEIEPGTYIPRAEWLYRGATDVRRKWAGVDHPETAASEVQLAWQLILGARRESLPYRRESMLLEAEELALHAQRVFDDNDDKSYFWQIRRVAIETAFARADFPEVIKRVSDLPAAADYEKGPGLYPDATAADLLVRARELVRVEKE